MLQKSVNKEKATYMVDFVKKDQDFEKNTSRDKQYCFRGNIADIDSILIVLILLKEFILDYMGVGLAVNLIICCLILIRLFTSDWKMPRFVYLTLGIITILFISNYGMGGDLEVYTGNVLRICQVLVYVLFLIFCKETRCGFFDVKQKKMVMLFNGILLINIAMMIVQYLNPGDFVAMQNGPVQGGSDLISGFFGYGSTHAIAIFTTFVVVYDLYYYKFVRNKLYYVFYLALLIIWSLYIATLNDNKALFFFLPFGVVLYLIIWASFEKKRIIRLFGVIIVSVFLLVLAYCFVPLIHDFVEKNIFHSIEMVLRAMEPGSYVNGSDERFKAIPFSLSQNDTWSVGQGFGSAGIYQEGYLGFNHFGMSDFGSIMILGGIWIYVTLVFFVSVAISFSPKKGESSFLLGIIIATLLIFASIYTQIFTQVRIAIPLLMLGMMLYEAQKDNCIKSDQKHQTGGVQNKLSPQNRII